MRRCPTTAPAQSPARSAVSLSISLKKQVYKNRHYYLLLIPAIVYLAAISGIDTQRYEAAYVDGANRLQQGAYITIPGIAPVIIILFLLSLSNIMNAGFEQIFNLYNPQVYEVADIIDTYVYRVGVLSAEFSFGAAVGLFKNVIGLVLLLLVNALARRRGRSTERRRRDPRDSTRRPLRTVALPPRRASSEEEAHHSRGGFS